MPRFWATNLQQIEFNLLSVFLSKAYFLSICGGEFLCIPQTFLFYFPWVLGHSRQCLELALCSEVIPEGHRRLYRTLGIESCSNSYTANALPAVPFFSDPILSSPLFLFLFQPLQQFSRIWVDPTTTNFPARLVPAMSDGLVPRSGHAWCWRSSVLHLAGPGQLSRSRNVT